MKLKEKSNLICSNVLHQLIYFALASPNPLFHHAAVGSHDSLVMKAQWENHSASWPCKAFSN